MLDVPCFLGADCVYGLGAACVGGYAGVSIRVPMGVQVP